MPGMTVRVRLITSEPHKVMLIPPDCRVKFLRSEDNDLSDAEVLVLNDRNAVETCKLKVGQRQYQYDGFVRAIEGLKANDWVVTRGASGAYHVGSTVTPEKIATPPPPWAAISVPPSVTVAHPVVREVTDYEEFAGHIEAAQTAEIRARVTGNLDKIDFKPGESVKKGDVLFEIDPRLYQAEFDQAAGGVKQAQIRFSQKTKDFAHFQELLKRSAATQAAYDKVKGERDEAEAALHTAQAALNVAHLRLDYTKIIAPFAGKIGRSLLDAGNLVTADKTVLATLASTDPMYVYFDIDERTAIAVRRNAAKNPAMSFPVACGLSGEEGFPRHSTVESAESRINPNTGTLSLCGAAEQGRDAPARHVRPRAAGDISAIQGALGPRACPGQRSRAEVRLHRQRSECRRAPRRGSRAVSRRRFAGHREGPDGR